MAFTQTCPIPSLNDAARATYTAWQDALNDANSSADESAEETAQARFADYDSAYSEFENARTILADAPSDLVDTLVSIDSIPGWGLTALAETDDGIEADIARNTYPGEAVLTRPAGTITLTPGSPIIFTPTTRNATPILCVAPDALAEHLTTAKNGPTQPLRG